MSDGIIFLNVGQKHLRNLAVSLWSLRKHYDGPVTILAGDDNVEKFIGTTDSRLGDTTIQPFEFEKVQKRNGCYFAKTNMWAMSPYMRTIYLDCDTVIHGDITDLWPGTEEVVNWTQFADWSTQTGRIKNRINGEGWPEIFPKEVAYQTANKYPAINTGILGFSRSSERVMKRWHEETRKNVSFICDEICAQLLAFEYPHNIMDHRWNASPRYSYDALGLNDLESSDVRIVHSHGNKGLKCGEGQQKMFLAAYFEAFYEDFAGLQEWDDKVAKGMKHPSKFVKRFTAAYRSWCRSNDCEPAKLPKRFDLNKGK